MLAMKWLGINWRQSVAEFVVIVFGVLAALAVDQWWTEREDRNTEAEYISRIRADLQSDIDGFLWFEEIFEIKANVIRGLRDYPDSDLLSRDQETLMQELVFSGFIALPDSFSTTFDELVSTGRLALVDSAERRDALSRYYSGFEHISAIVFEPEGEYKRVLWESFPAEFLDRDSKKPNLIDPAVFSEGLEGLLADSRLRAAANAEIVYADMLVSYSSQFRIRAEQLLKLLEE